MNEWATEGNCIVNQDGVVAYVLQEYANLVSASPDLLALAEAVEWIQVFDQYGDEVGHACPWCDEYRDDACADSGHAPDCPRQAAIAKAAGSDG